MTKTNKANVATTTTTTVDVDVLAAAYQTAKAKVAPTAAALRLALGGVPSVDIAGNVAYPIRPIQIPAARAEIAHLEAKDAAGEAETALRAALDAKDGDRLAALADELREGHAAIVELVQRAQAKERELYARLDTWRGERAALAKEREAAGLPLPADAPTGANLVELRQRLQEQLTRPPSVAARATNAERRRRLANAIATTSAQLEREAREAEEERERIAARKEHERRLAVAHEGRMAEQRAAEAARQAAEVAEKEQLAAAWAARGITGRVLGSEATK